MWSRVAMGSPGQGAEVDALISATRAGPKGGLSIYLPGMWISYSLYYIPYTSSGESHSRHREVKSSEF